MSYILDALQHREAQDNPDTAVQTVIKRHQDQRMRLLWLVVAAALVVNAGVVIWLLLPESGAPTPDSTTQTVPTTAPAPVTPVAQVPTEAAPAPLVAAKKPVQEPPPRKIRTSLERLPASTRKRFPGLVFSTHIYAEDPSLRAVVVNGARLTEGDAMAGATLEHVTATGVVMEFENYLVEIPVIDNWQ